MLRNDLYKPWFAKWGKDESDWGFEVIDGEFSGVVVQVTKMDMREETKEDPSNLVVEYHIIGKPEHLDYDLKKNNLFNNLFQVIINDIVKEAVESYEHIDRDNNSEESNSQ